jgi:hypothetical protein
VDLVAVHGVVKLGGHDIFTLVSKEVGKEVGKPLDTTGASGSSRPSSWPSSAIRAAPP